jgi:hypothetical protein
MFNKKICGEIGKAVVNALSEVEEEFNIKFFPGGGSFDESKFTLKLNCVPKDNKGVALSPMKEDFKKYASSFGLKPEDIGKKFVRNNITYKIAGLKLANRKFPIICENCQNKKMYKLNEVDVKRALDN